LIGMVCLGGRKGDIHVQADGAQLEVGLRARQVCEELGGHAAHPTTVRKCIPDWDKFRISLIIVPQIVCVASFSSRQELSHNPSPGEDSLAKSGGVCWLWLFLFTSKKRLKLRSPMASLASGLNRAAMNCVGICLCWSSAEASPALSSSCASMMLRAPLCRSRESRNTRPRSQRSRWASPRHLLRHRSPASTQSLVSGRLWKRALWSKPRFQLPLQAWWRCSHLERDIRLMSC
jgi:hypothetical protein